MFSLPKSFSSDGFAVLRNVVPRVAVIQALLEVDTQLNDLIRALVQTETIDPSTSNEYQKTNIHHRLSMLDVAYPSTSTLLHKNVRLRGGLHDLVTSNDIHQIAQQALGCERDELRMYPHWSLRCKTPDRLNRSVHTQHWHQRRAYYPTLKGASVTLWIPLVPIVGLECGPLCAAQGPQPYSELMDHEVCYGSSWYPFLSEEVFRAPSGEPSDDVKPIALTDVSVGDVIVLSDFLPIRDLENFTKLTRWSVDCTWCTAEEKEGLKVEEVKSRVPLCGPVDWKDKNVLNPVVNGPWMKHWPLTNPTDHTEQLV
eukprot:PhF_6_TR38709/c0_g1_i1/m.57932